MTRTYIKNLDINGGNSVYLWSSTCSVNYAIFNEVSATIRDLPSGTYSERLPSGVYNGYKPAVISLNAVGHSSGTSHGLSVFNKDRIEAIAASSEDTTLYDDYFGIEIKIVIDSITVKRSSKASADGYWWDLTIKATQVKL